jgi:hypothetical protein
MKITVNKKVKTVRFEELSPGSIFMLDGHAHVKLSQSFEYNSYRLGALSGGNKFGRGLVVTPVEEIILIEEGA